MNILLAIWSSISYIGSFYIATFLVAFKLEKKTFLLPKAIFCFGFISIIGHLYNQLFMNYGINSVTIEFFRSMVCVLFFLSALFMLKWCYHCSIWEALFCSSAGYCMEHITQRLSVLFDCLIGLEPYNNVLSSLILITLTFVFYTLIFRKIIYKNNYSHIIADSKPQLLISIIVLLLTITLSSTAGYLADQLESPFLGYHIYIYSIVSASLALFIEFALLLQKNAEYEKNILEQLMHENKNQFQIEKSAIDVINIKCHDLKHQFHQLQKRVAPEALEDIEHAVNAYDFIFHTGNRALDTVLTMKSLQCEKSDITMTCMGDGAALSFLSDSDIYSLFGNILDNAIEAVTSLTNPDQKVIGLTITTQSNFIFIHSENYYAGDIQYQNGLPITHKKDKQYHGFGIHSIQLIVEKYHGSYKFSDEYQVFSTDISLPIL